MADDWRSMDDETPAAKLSPTGAKGCLWRLLALLLVLSMVGSAVASLLWLWQLRQAQIPDLSQVVVVTPTAVLPTTTTESAIVSATLTAVSPLLTAVPTVDPGRVDRIVFIDTNDQIQTISPDGSGAQQLTMGGVDFRFPAWSPDGQQIAAIGNGRSSAGIYVVGTDANDSHLTSVYSDSRRSPIYLSWSPDGQQVSFIAPSPSRGTVLLVAPADGSGESRELAAGRPFYWQWGSDSSQILFSTNALVGFVDLADGQQETVAVAGRFQAPDISADGRFLAYGAADRLGRNSQLVVQDTQTGEQSTTDYDGVVALGWNPTANQLAYISPAQESSFFFGPLRLLDAESGNSRVLSNETVLAFFWSPNGRSIAYISLLRSPAGTQQAADRRQLAKPAQQGTDFQLALSLVDVETGVGLKLLQFHPTALYLNLFIPFFDQYAHSHQVWSPDSDALVLPIEQDGVAQIVIVPATGGRILPLAEGSIAFWSRQ